MQGQDYTRLSTEDIFICYIRTRLKTLGGPAVTEFLTFLPDLRDPVDPRIYGVIAYILGVEFGEVSSKHGQALSQEMTLLIPDCKHSRPARNDLRNFLSKHFELHSILDIMKSFVYTTQAIHRAQLTDNLSRAMELVDWALEYHQDKHMDMLVEQQGGWEQYASREWYRDFPHLLDDYQNYEQRINQTNMMQQIEKSGGCWAAKPFSENIFKLTNITMNVGSVLRATGLVVALSIIGYTSYQQLKERRADKK